MRSVLTFLPNCTADMVEEFLAITLPSGSSERPDLQHIVSIDIYSPEAAISEIPETYEEITMRFGTQPLVVIADISGRVDGTPEATAFSTGLLRRFGGVALDDYSDHLWTLDELLTGATFRGHHFFDTAGWYHQSQAPSDMPPSS